LQCASYRHFFPEHRGRARDSFAVFPWMDEYLSSAAWGEWGLDETANADLRMLFTTGGLRFGMHYPMTVRIDGHVLPGYFINHHAAHAASTFYQSGYERAGILTHDGFTQGVGMLSGMFSYGEGHRIYPLAPHHLNLGAVYDEVGRWLGLGDVGPAGKLMGLAAYGLPRFFSRQYVGNVYDLQRRKLPSWREHCTAQAKAAKYDMGLLGQRAQATTAVNIDIAASTQKLFEETLLAATETLHRILQRHGRQCATLCLSGGTALNCPANTRVFRE